MFGQLEMSELVMTLAFLYPHTDHELCYKTCRHDV